MTFPYNRRKLAALEIFFKVYPGLLRPTGYVVRIDKYPFRAAYSCLLKL